MKLQYGKAICYSGYRDGQSPHTKTYPTYEEVKEDLLILEKDFNYIRMYDSSHHAQTACEVIKNENLDLKIMLGMDLLGEISNPDCSWGGKYSVEQIAKNITYNQDQLNKLIDLANTYEDIVYAVSAGNESVPEWNENLVSPGRVLYFVKQLKKYTNSPVTYCENYIYWTNKLKDVAKAVDIISVHSYPVWVGTPIKEAVQTCIDEYQMITKMYPKKPVIITETGWPTRSNGQGIPKDFANQANQLYYYDQIQKWSEDKQVTCFFFEAFDEFWKGSTGVDEPEKHWGFYFINRTPKIVKCK
jgi:exo-beta-1,3-glucanase (GH17 family)